MSKPDQLPGPELYAFTECEAVHMSNGAVLLLDTFSDAQVLVAPPVAQSMQTCRSFRTLEDHARHLTTTVAELAGQADDVMKVLVMLRDAGLMTSATAICERLNAPVPAAVDLPATRAFIITCDRPQAVERLLESMLRAGTLSRHQSLFLVDDSRDADNATRNRDAVEKFNLTSPRDMHYFGADEASRFMADLINEIPDQENAIRFLIDRQRWSGEKTYGLARNLCLLLSVGRRAIVMDDDVLCTAILPPHSRPGVEFGTVDREAGFYSDHQAMLNSTSAADFDPLTGHARCLGLNMGQALEKLQAAPVRPADLEGMNASYLRLWDARSPVLVTQCGTLGDPGSPNTDWLYFAQGDTARRLTEFPGGLEGALASRCYWLGHPRPCFTKMAVMSQITGLDNSQLLPPYFPAHRGEDYLFAAMTENMHPSSTVLSYDWCVPHLPVEQRRAVASPEPKSGKGLFSAGKYITDRTCYQLGINAQTRLQNIANMATQLSQTDDRGLATLFRKEVAQLQGLEQYKISALLNDGSIRAPLWQSWLEESAANLNQAMQTLAQVSDLPEVTEGQSSTQLLAQFRTYAAGFGESLASWESMREAARRVSERT